MRRKEHGEDETGWMGDGSCSAMAESMIDFYRFYALFQNSKYLVCGGGFSFQAISDGMGAFHAAPLENFKNV